MASIIKAAIKDLYHAIDSISRFGKITKKGLTLYDANSAVKFLFSNHYELRRFGFKTSYELISVCIDPQYVRRLIYDGFKNGLTLEGIGILDPLNDKGMMIFDNVLGEIAANDHKSMSDKVPCQVSA